MAEPQTTPDRAHRLAWERQKGEGEKQYAHFVQYRDMGRGRTVAKVAERLQRSRGYLYSLSRDKNWVRRVEAWDREVDREFAQLLADRRKRMVEQTLAIIGAARVKLVARLNAIRPEDLSPSDWIKWFEILLKAEKEAVGLPGQVVGISGPEGGPIEAEITALTDEERKTYLLRLVAEANQRAGIAAGYVEGEVDEDERREEPPGTEGPEVEDPAGPAPSVE